MYFVFCIHRCIFLLPFVCIFHFSVLIFVRHGLKKIFWWINKNDRDWRRLRRLWLLQILARTTTVSKRRGLEDKFQWHMVWIPALHQQNIEEGVTSMSNSAFSSLGTTGSPNITYWSSSRSFSSFFTLFMSSHDERAAIHDKYMQLNLIILLGLMCSRWVEL